MSEVNWNRVFAISSFVVAVMLVSGSIYLHIRHKPHLGRMHHDYDEKAAVTAAGVAGNEAAAVMVDSSERTQQLGEDSNANVITQHALHELAASALSEVCLQCICETVSECSASTCGAEKKPCGLYRISRPYWLDAGQLHLQGDSSIIDAELDGGYSHCVNNAYCSARTVVAFMQKYSRDCNADGVIDCRDYIAMHIQGPTGCETGVMQTVFQSRMEMCLAKFS